MSRMPSSEDGGTNGFQENSDIVVPRASMKVLDYLEQRYKKTMLERKNVTSSTSKIFATRDMFLFSPEHGEIRDKSLNDKVHGAHGDWETAKIPKAKHVDMSTNTYNDNALSHKDNERVKFVYRQHQEVQTHLSPVPPLKILTFSSNSKQLDDDLGDLGRPDDTFGRERLYRDQAISPYKSPRKYGHRDQAISPYKTPRTDGHRDQAISPYKTPRREGYNQKSDIGVMAKENDNEIPKQSKKASPRKNTRSVPKSSRIYPRKKNDIGTQTNRDKPGNLQGNEMPGSSMRKRGNRASRNLSHSLERLSAKSYFERKDRIHKEQEYEEEHNGTYSQYRGEPMSYMEILNGREAEEQRRARDMRNGMRNRDGRRQKRPFNGDRVHTRQGDYHDPYDGDSDGDLPPEEKDTYVFYMKTDDGEVIGPLRLDIDDVMIGLPGSDQRGLKNRQVGSHGLNEFSSRSHSMMSLMIDSEVQNSEDENLYITKRGKLTFVDLAGSEKVKLGSVIGGRDTLIESKNINKSLLVLGNCISALGDAKKKHGHIPYRDSKLTKLLADSLSGNGVTLMIACITPSSYNVTETLNTLRYANRAKKIRSKPVVKMDPREHLILNLKKEMKVLRNENQYLRQQLEFPAKPKGQLQKENDKRFFEFLKQEKIANGRTGTVPETGLYEMLQEYMVENEALRSENANLHATRDQIRREQQLIYRQNERLQSRVEDLERLVSKSPINFAPPLRYGGPDDPNLGYDQSPRQSPPPQTYRQGGAPPASVKRPNPRQMPQDLPVIHPSLVTASPAKQPSKGRGRGQSMRPPHRLSDPVIRPQGREQPPQQPGPSDYPPTGARDSPRTQKPNYPVPSRKTHHNHQPTNMQNAESINDINAKLRQELLELEGEIQQQAKIVHNPYPERHGRKSISGIYVAENVKT